MALAGLIRQTTLPMRDALSTIDAELERALAERDAAEERAKRCSTEITRQHTLEASCRRQLDDADERVAVAQRSFEELSLRRQQALEDLLRCGEEREAITQALREARTSTEAALADIGKEQKARQGAETRVERHRAERTEKERALRQAVLRSLDLHLKSQAVQFYSAFDSQEQRAGVLRASEELKRARHSDPEVGRLCEQREELQKFLSSATVPAVRDMLQASVKAIEDQLDKRFPGGLASPPRDESRIDDLLYYNQGGKVVFLLPVDSAAWYAAAADDATEDASRAMCLVWSFLREMKLRTEDGEFSVRRGRPVYKSRFEVADVPILQAFSARHCGSVLMRFVLSAVPTEVQEALSDEDQNG